MQTEELKQIGTHLDHLFDIMGGLVLPPLLRLAANLDIADLLKDKPQHVLELAKATNSHPDALYRVLRLLANEGIFIEMENRVFAQNEVSHQLRRDVPFSMRDYVSGEWLPEWIWKTICNLSHSVQTGESAFCHAHDGVTLWDYFSKNPQVNQRFSRNMASISKAYDGSIVSEYDFSDIQTVVDTGGAHGSFLSAILQANSHLHGILFDLPPVIEEAKKYICSSEVSTRCQLEAGSFFETLPSGADIYLLRYILHNWDDENCIQILKNCRESSSNAKVLIVERVLQPQKNSRFTLALDLWMLMFLGHAKERTEEEYRILLEAAGYRLNRVIPTASPLSIVEGEPVRTSPLKKTD